MTSVNTQALPSHVPQIEYVTKTKTVDEYLDEKVRQFRSSCYLVDLTCARLARIALCREVREEMGIRLLYSSAKRLLHD